MADLTESWSERWRARWRRPHTLTALVPVGDVPLAAVHANLQQLAPDIGRALAGLPGLHAFRLVAVPPAQPGGPTRVLLNSVFDPPRDEHVPVLLGAIGAPLVRAFAGAGVSRVDELPDLLMRFRVREETFHLGAINQSVEATLAEQRLLEAVEAFADAQVAAGQWGADTPAEQIRREIQAHVLAQPPEAGLPRAAAPALPLEARALRLVDLVLTFAFPAIGVLAPHIAKAIQRLRNPAARTTAWVAYGLWWIYGALFTGGAMLFVRLLEKIEPDVVAPPPDPEKVRRIEDREDLQLTNPVTFWLPVRDTLIRRTLLHVILWGSERGCRHFWTNGALADIETIHYARIMGVDASRTMLFMSDYDGSLDRYLMDFLGVGSSAVIPISSNVATCPKTRWLFYPDNPVDFDRRMRLLLRAYQLEMAVWYSAYPNLSVRDIRANAALREGLFAETMTPEDAAQWTAML